MAYPRFLLVAALGLSLWLWQPVLLPAAILGTNQPAQPLTPERIAALPADRQRAWKDYLERSTRQLRADQAVFQAELRRLGLQEPVIPPEDRGVRSIPLDKPPEWYGQAEGKRLADNILSFQTAAGGWSKNLNFARHLRAPGEHFAPGNASRFPSSLDNDAPRDSRWHYVGTFDNDATVTQLRYLAKVIAALKPGPAARYRAAFLRGLDYILAAQYPNGGWPQVWPLEGGYHDAITFNDDAMLNVLALLREVAEPEPEFSFVPAKKRALAAASFRRGLLCIVATQVKVKGQLTVWCQQHDPLTLQPAAARNYEMPSLVSAESAQLMMFLMELPRPEPDIVAAVHAAAAWFDKTKINDVAYKDTDGNGRRLVSAPGEGPLWARFYEIGTARPIFGDRDKTIHDTVDEISKERRNGYGWYRDTPKRALEHYIRWSRLHEQGG
jgi:PelA/Pel-15E family pectate lyase